MKFAYCFDIESDLASTQPTNANPQVLGSPDSGQVLGSPDSRQGLNRPEPGQGLNGHEHWLFDLDGCLVDSFDGTSLRPLARELIETLLQQGHSVDIWSAGGAEYAERVARRVGISHLIGTFWTKDRGSSGKWTLPQDLAGRQIVCVDDQPDGVPLGVEKIAVFPYLGPNPHDQVLRKLLDRAASASVTS